MGPAGLLYGQDRMQFAQDVPFFRQKARHVSGFVCHLRAPGLLEGVGPRSAISPVLIEREGHVVAHLLQTSQNSLTPNEIGLSGTRGASVKTLHSRTRGP